MKIPRPDADSREFFKSIVPDDPRVTVRPLFGNLSAFVNGNMFLGLFGNDLFVRLSDEDQQVLLLKEGAGGGIRTHEGLRHRISPALGS